MTGKEIKEKLGKIVSAPNLYGFQVFAVMKNGQGIKQLVFKEDDSLLNDIKEEILKTISEKYCSDTAEYVSADRIADEQNKFYIIETSDEYNPFSVLELYLQNEKFSVADIENTTGIAFSIEKGTDVIWAYQQVWSMMIPNKTKKRLSARIVSRNQGDVFVKMDDPILTIGKNVDLLIVDDHIIASDHKLLQNKFGFHEYIRIRSEKTISSIEGTGLLKDTEILHQYVQRGDGSPKYAKKMMRIADSSVLRMQKDTLLENIQKSKRWNGKLKIEDGKFEVKHYTEVELLIDLLDERYTISEITGTEYDTDVKQKAEPVQ